MTDPATDLADLYQQTILRHAATPRHAHRPATIDGAATGENRLCGDHVEVFVRRDPAGHLAEIGFTAEACAITRASADMMADALQGATPLAARALAAHVQDMIETGNSHHPALAPLRALAGLHAYPARRRCALLPWEALLDALEPAETPA